MFSGTEDVNIYNFDINISKCDSFPVDIFFPVHTFVSANRTLIELWETGSCANDKLSLLNAID
jgi:hypothetical protein